VSNPHLARVRVYPVKSLDPLERSRSSILPAGGLVGDRTYVVRDADGRAVNGKREPAVHGVDAVFEPGDDVCVLRDRADEQAADAFALADPDGREDAAAWFSECYGYPVTVERDESGVPDDATAPGPTVVSTATLAAVADWFDLPTAAIRRRFRANLEIGGVPAFWEDRLYADPDHVVRVRVGDASFLGMNPCARFVVSSRDSRTGTETPRFRETFVERREATLPAWADDSWYDHYYRLAVNTAVPEETVGESVAVGDPVEIVGVEGGNPQSR